MSTALTPLAARLARQMGYDEAKLDALAAHGPVTVERLLDDQAAKRGLPSSSGAREAGAAHPEAVATKLQQIVHADSSAMPGRGGDPSKAEGTPSAASARTTLEATFAGDVLREMAGLAQDDATSFRSVTAFFCLIALQPLANPGEWVAVQIGEGRAILALDEPLPRLGRFAAAMAEHEPGAARYLIRERARYARQSESPLASKCVIELGDDPNETAAISVTVTVAEPDPGAELAAAFLDAFGQLAAEPRRALL